MTLIIKKQSKKKKNVIFKDGEAKKDKDNEERKSTSFHPKMKLTKG